jgi:hypothetical protein
MCKSEVLLSSSYVKVSKYRKQIFLSSHTPKNQRNFSHFFALASKNGRIKKIKVLYCIKLHELVFLFAFIFCFKHFLWLFRS